jgi:peptidoglycan/xylan/chitin deacetylase (PgdA/CDA1 family)
MMFTPVANLGIKILNLFAGTDSFSVLNYHRVIPDGDLTSVEGLTPELFELQLIWLKRHFKVLPLPTAFSLAQAKMLPKNTVVITIDDGFYDCFTYVYPLLKKHQLTATFFISTSGIEQGYLWENQISYAIFHAPTELTQLELQQQTFRIGSAAERRTSVAEITELTKYQPLQQRQLMIDDILTQCNCPAHLHQFLTKDQIITMHQNGMTIGAHTVHHPILALETYETAQKEIADSKQLLEQIIESPIEFFAYPNGKYQQDFNDDHVSIVEKLGFKAAFSTEWGVAQPDVDGAYKLKRFTPWDRSPSKFCLRLAMNTLAERYYFRFFKSRVRQHVR